MTRRLLLVLLALIALAAPAAASSWYMTSDSLTPEERAVAAYGAVSLPGGGLAWIEMTAPSSGWNGSTWSAETQYWRVIRADAAGGIVWESEEFTLDRATMVVGWLGSTRGGDWYDPDLIVLDNGNLLAWDSVPPKVAFTGNSFGALSPARSWIREIDAATGATLWESDLTGWAVTGIVERSEGGYWAVAVGPTPAWTKGGIYSYATTPEATWILSLNATGSAATSWRVHAEPYRTHSSSHAFGIAPVAGSDEYWIYGWKSLSNRVYTSNPVYSAILRPQIDRINPVTRTDAQYVPETHTATGIGSIPGVHTGVTLVNSYHWGLPDVPMRLTGLSDGGALITYGNLNLGPTCYLTKMSSTGAKLWSKTYTSPVSGAEIPVIDVVETPGGALLAVLQDGDLIRINRLDSFGNVQESIVIADPGGTVTAQRIISAPSTGNPYGIIVTGSTTGFGATGEEALVVYLDDLEDVINLGSGSLTLSSDVAYAAEEVEVSASLVGADWGNATYWVSVVGEDGTLYETLDVRENETEHTLSTLHPAGNYTITLSAYCEEYESLQVLTTASLVRQDMGTVEWDRDVTYLGEQAAIGYSYIPNYEIYSYWIEVRDPADLRVEIQRLPTTGAIRPNPGNMTDFGQYTAELFAIRKSDETRIHGNTSTVILSPETWLYGRVADIYHIGIPGATVEVRQPTHPDPEVAAAVRTGVAGADGSYEVLGLVPRYSAEVTVSADGYYDHIETVAVNVSGKIYYPVYMTAIPPPPLPEIVGKAVFPPRNNPAVGFEIVCENSTATLTETSGADGYFAFPPLAPDTAYTVYARNATGHRVSEAHTYALGRGQTIDLLLEIRDESLLPRGVDFTADPVSGGAPLRVSFQATGANVTAWHWVYGDRATGTGQSTTHTYGAGLWTVTLQAENYYGVREVTRENLISVSGSGGVPVQAPVRFIIQTYSGQPLANVNVTATPLESTGPLAWLLDLFGVSGGVDINGTVLSGSTDTGGGIVLTMIRTVKYHVAVTDPGRGIDTQITIYPQEDEVLISVWPQETTGPANDFELYAEEEAGDTRVGVRYATADLTRITFTVSTEAGEIVAQKVSTGQTGDLSHVIDGEPGEVYLYGYMAEHKTAGELRQDQYIRFSGEARPWVDFAPWIPMYAYQWASILIIVGFSWTFGRGEIRGGMLTIPVLAGILQVIGWLQLPWLLLGTVLVLGFLIYTRLSEDDLRI
ncbi:MAG: hypothetical protein LLF90_03850 [Methanomicrobiaceae archaeon]|nr:hypothetical protein [Methanomicrobiaceae archaeon]